jgi:hypothetical protein
MENVTPMRVLEPAAQHSEVDTAVPEQRTASEADQTVVVDHVGAHSMRCYWDFDDDRWWCKD